MSERATTGAEDGAGWLTALAVAANTALLALARLAGAGDYGAAGLPFLIAHFVLCGVLAARAVLSLLRAAPRSVVVTLAAAAGVVGMIGSARAWAVTPATRPLLPPLLAWAAVPAALWALGAPRRQRAAAVATALTTVVLWVLGVRLDH